MAFAVNSRTRVMVLTAIMLVLGGHTVFYLHRNWDSIQMKTLWLRRHHHARDFNQSSRHEFILTLISHEKQLLVETQRHSQNFTTTATKDFHSSKSDEVCMNNYGTGSPAFPQISPNFHKFLNPVSSADFDYASAIFG